VVPTIETSAQEADAALDSTTLCVKDAEDRATIAEREARERVSRMEAENAAALACAHEDAEALVRKITLLEGERVEERQARELAEENSRGLSDVTTNAEHRREVPERERWDQFEELTLLQIRAL
jgi:hypothetical protein